MDAVYRVRPGGQHEELRYSLRSLAVHLPVDDVWIAGYRPEWVRGVRHVPSDPTGTRYQRSLGNLVAACNGGVAESFVLVDDDFFFLRPWEGITYHMGPFSEALQLKQGQYRGFLAKVAQAIGGDPLCYDLHVPMPMTRVGVLETVERYGASRELAAGIRSLYGNLFEVGGERMDDVKIKHPKHVDLDALPFVSTNDSVFQRGEIGKQLRERFPDPSPYER